MKVQGVGKSGRAGSGRSVGLPHKHGCGGRVAAVADCIPYFSLADSFG